MLETCSMCGRVTEPDALLGPVCGRCDKLVGDVETEMVILSWQGSH